LKKIIESGRDRTFKIANEIDDPMAPYFGIKKTERIVFNTSPIEAIIKNTTDFPIALRADI
jgi:hypothetical protein